MPRAPHPLVTTRRRVGALLLTATLALGGCGGGIYIGIDGSGDSPPNVSLAIATSRVGNEVTIDMSAFATDDYRVTKVEFWFIDDLGNRSMIATDFTSPYSANDFFRIVRTGSIFYLARAFDDNGQYTDTGWQEIRLL
ncbi:Ig-like domain-containing protein [Sphaerotilus mobilis]|uniref:Uncharacterized protein n=1 Tax=Sphaerotilus mobilis TaxID=47994 RepID=A0A4V2EV43_9BURK|nr:Ig-like domain-containing protein [Sphaerotilus mobilis]RZS47403.1 hypothetical protein EV685_3606 [Sphaerotilus mobilis]